MLRRYVISVLPTGYGKSVIFHLLLYMWDFINEMGDKSIVIVVSPLNALIEDQETSLKVRGIKAGVLRASCQQGSFDYVYDSDTGSVESDDESEEKRSTASVRLRCSTMCRKEKVNSYLHTQRLLYLVKMAERYFSRIYMKIAWYFV